MFLICSASRICRFCLLFCGSNIVVFPVITTYSIFRNLTYSIFNLNVLKTLPILRFFRFFFYQCYPISMFFLSAIHFQNLTLMLLLLDDVWNCLIPQLSVIEFYRYETSVIHKRRNLEGIDLFVWHGRTLSLRKNTFFKLFQLQMHIILNSTPSLQLKYHWSWTF